MSKGFTDFSFHPVALGGVTETLADGDSQPRRADVVGGDSDHEVGGLEPSASGEDEVEVRLSCEP